MPQVLHIPLAMGASGIARQQRDARPRKSSWHAIPTKCVRSLDGELAGHTRGRVLEGHEPLQLGSDLGKDPDPDSHDGLVVGVRCRGIVVCIRLPFRLLESGSTVDHGSVPDLLIFLTLPGLYRRVVQRCHARLV
jgi:hypothetical protein